MPVNTSVLPRSIEPCAARAIMSGRRVPKSPSDPEISVHGAIRRAAKLFRFTRRKLFDQEGAIFVHLCRALQSSLRSGIAIESRTGDKVAVVKHGRVHVTMLQPKDVTFIRDTRRLENKGLRMSSERLILRWP
jgi:hypothetical protein